MTERHINLDGLCSCGSKKPILECCLKEFLPLMSGPKTGLKNSDCYAAESSNCSDKISREHYISQSVLTQIQGSGALNIEGVPWASVKKTVSSQNLTSKILCKRHNETLSGLDSVAKRFFKTILNIIEEFKVENVNGQDEIFLFNGYDIEKWMLKTLIGIGVSGNATYGSGGVIKNWKPNPYWIDILFDAAVVPEKLGLYVSNLVGEKNPLTSIPTFQITPVSNVQAGIYGSIIFLSGMKFILVMSPPRDTKGTILENHIYRPNELIFTNGRTQKAIVFYWNTKVIGGSITIKVEPPEKQLNQSS